MKKYFFLLKIVLAIAVLLGMICAAQAEEKAGEKAEEKTLPRVELVSEDRPAILRLKNKDVTVKARLTYTDQNGSFTYPILIKLQGAYTLRYPKKNYTIKFYSDDTYAEKQKVSFVDSWGKHSKYCLKANYQDSTMARNIVGARLAADMNRPYGIFPDAPNCGQTDGFPVELYIDGEYRGLFTLNIPKDGWMLGMSKKNENHLLMYADYVSRDAILFLAESVGDGQTDWKIEHGPEDDEEAVAAAYEKLNRAIRFVMNSTDEEFHEHFEEYFSLDASLNYYCFVWYTNTTDNMAKNMMLATLDGEIWYPILYDLDTSFGLYFDGEGVYSSTLGEESYQGADSLFWRRLDQVFAKELSQRYFELRKTVLNEAYIMRLFEEFESAIPDEAWERERELWRAVPGLEYGLDSIRQHIREREPFVDEVFSRMGAE